MGGNYRREEGWPAWYRVVGSRCLVARDLETDERLRVRNWRGGEGEARTIYDPTELGTEH